MPASRKTPEGARSDGLTEAEIALLQLRATRYAQRPIADAQDVTYAVLFRKADARYVIPLASLREIRLLPAVCRIPGAARWVPGVFHFQGEILSAHDLDAFMDQGASEGPSPWVLIVEQGSERLGLMVDEVIDVVAVVSARVMPVPITFGERSICFQGVLPGGALLLQPARLFSTPSFFSAF